MTNAMPMLKLPKANYIPSAHVLGRVGSARGCITSMRVMLNCFPVLFSIVQVKKTNQNIDRPESATENSRAFQNLYRISTFQDIKISDINLPSFSQFAAANFTKCTAHLKVTLVSTSIFHSHIVITKHVNKCVCLRLLQQRVHIILQLDPGEFYI